MKPFGMKYRKNNPQPRCWLFSVNLGLSIRKELDFIVEYLAERVSCGLTVKALQGRYDGKDEQAYIIAHEESSALFLSAILELMRETKQTEVYFLQAPVLSQHIVKGLSSRDDFRGVYHVGLLKPCTQSRAYLQSGFTLDAGTGQHYYIDEE